jgi:hypothetical protein
MEDKVQVTYKCIWDGIDKADVKTVIHIQSGNLKIIIRKQVAPAETGKAFAVLLTNPPILNRRKSVYYSP